MLRSLTTHNFVVIHTLDLDLADGFTVFTGETGAGKSTLIDAFALTLDERADTAVVREDAPHADIIAKFGVHSHVTAWLEAHELHDDEGVILLRHATDAASRSKTFINGAAITLAQLREVGEQLVDTHDQHTHQLLLKADAQRSLLDAHAGLEGAVRTVGGRYREWHTAVRAREVAEQQSRKAQLERERIEWQVNELQKLGPQPGEWEEVQAEHHCLSHAASLVEGTCATLDGLSESEGAVLTQLGTTLHTLRELAEIDPTLVGVLIVLEPAEMQIQEAVHTPARYADRTELSPGCLAEVDARMQALHTMARKYRVTPETLPAELVKRQVQLATLQATSDLDALQAQEAQTHAVCMPAAQALSRDRAKAARELADAMTGAIQGLSMAGGRFDIVLPALEHGGTAGLEQVEFLVARYAGVSPQSLVKVTSDGELARISLAISVIVSEASPTPTLIFDEVDSGIGGAVAEIVGRRLRKLDMRRQVLCVTHLPQVAALTNHHIQVAKQTVAGNTRSDLVVLDATGRVDEITRMLGGASLADTTHRHTDEMLAAGRAQSAPEPSTRKSRRVAQRSPISESSLPSLARRFRLHPTQSPNGSRENLMARVARTIQPATRPRSLLSSAKPGLAVALGLYLLAACKSVPAIDPGEPPAMDPASASTQPPVSVSAVHSLDDVIVGLSAPTTSSATVQGLLDAAGTRATPRLTFAMVRPTSDGFWVVRTSSGDASATLNGAVAALRNMSGTASADPDRVVRIQR